MANKRVYFACQRAGIAPLGSTTYTTVRGLQTLTTTTTFNLAQAFEMGQLEIYENIEGVPDVTVTVEKVLDGYAPIYTLATQGGSSATLAGRAVAAARCMLGVGIYDEGGNATGTAIAACVFSGLYVNSVSYSVPVNDRARESVSLVGNDKTWVGGTAITFADDPFNGGTDQPLSISGSGGVQQREDVLFGLTGTSLPTQIPGINATGKNIDNGAEGFAAHVQSITISTNLGREDLFELGRKGTYYRYVNFPVEVTTEIGTTASSGDLISFSADGLYSEGGSCGRYNLTSHFIELKMCEGLHVWCGSGNKLASVNTTGGDAGGGNVEVTYTYNNFNTMSVYHPKDPNYGTAGFTVPIP